MVETTLNHLGPQDGNCYLVFAVFRKKKIRNLNIAVVVLVVAKLNVKGVRHYQIGNAHLRNCKDVARLRRHQVERRHRNQPSLDACWVRRFRHIAALDSHLHWHTRVIQKINYHPVIVHHFEMHVLQFFVFPCVLLNNVSGNSSGHFFFASCSLGFF